MTGAPADRRAETVLAIDLGGTATKIGLAAADGALTELAEIPTRMVDGAVPVDWLATLMRSVAAEHPVAGFGLVVPGVVVGGRVVAAPNVGWFDLPLAALLTERTGLAGRVDHDVRGGGLAEWRLGAGRGVDDFVFLPLGTGIAAAVVMDGRMLVAGGYAGEIGHVRVAAAAGQVCACGQQACLELVASAAGVRRGYARRRGIAPAEAPATRELAGLARDGDPAAAAAFATARDGLAEAVRLIASLYAPRRLAIGGGLSGALDLLLPGLRAGIDELTFQRRPEVVRAELGSRAGLVGAGLVARLGAEQVA